MKITIHKKNTLHRNHCLLDLMTEESLGRRSFENEKHLFFERFAL